ncbi:MAG TPA: hypothetical protein VM901_13285 [Bdellovibrionota bacterium]|jgi:hypothetical protein|nr:hypothetical protein [Bdellovibrionota bacterium]
MRSTFKTSIQNTFIAAAAVSGLGATSARAALYLENGIECLDKGPTLSVGDLIDEDEDTRDATNLGAHIKIYPSVLNRLKAQHLHPAGSSAPLKADYDKVDGTYEGRVTNDFGVSYAYLVTPVGKDLKLEIWDAEQAKPVFSETFKNCSPLK